MKRINLFLFFVLILAGAACIALPKLPLPHIKTQPPLEMPASVTPTAAAQPATKTALPLETGITPLPATQTLTAAPTLTPEPTATPLPPTATFTPTATPLPFRPVRVEAPAYLPNFTHTEKGCGWLGVGGQAFDLNGQPVRSWTVLVTGTLNGEVRQWLGLSGLATAYGPAGYEIELGNTPLETSGAFTIQLRDGSGQPLTEAFPFDTHADCQSGLVLINFVQVEPILELHLPIVTR